MPVCDACGGRHSGAARGGCAAPVVSPGPAPAPIDPAVPGYRATRLLGRGGFGTVHAATRESDGTEVALKVALPDSAIAAAQLDREAEALRAVGAPPVPALLEAGKRGDGTPWIALELVPLPTLDARLDGRTLPGAEAASAARALLEALAAMHAHGFAHLDLKPENVFWEGSEARLFDLGLARRFGSLFSDASIAQVAGTAAYMSPEQWDSRGRVDARADVYSAGVMLYELFTGRVPFFGPRGDVQKAHLGARPPRPSSLAEVSDAVEAVILRALAKEPEHRFASAKETAAALDEALREGRAAPDRAAQPARTAAPAGPQDRRPLGVVFLAATADAAATQSALSSFGGHLAVLAPGRCVAVFDAESSDNPVRRALRAAEAVLERRLAAHAIVDLRTVVVQQRKNGPPRFLSTAFNKPASFPREDDPEGILATAAACEQLPGVELKPVAGREGLSRLSRRVQQEATVLQLGVSPLIGREGVLNDLLTHAGESVALRQPGAAAVIADAGHGKSHLCAALLDALRGVHRGVDVLELRAREPVAGDADETFRSLLARGLGLNPQQGAVREHEVRARLSALLEADLAVELWPAVALAFGLQEAAGAGVRNLAAAPGALRTMAVRAAGEVLRHRAARGALCVVLDDAQFADDATFDALEYAALAEGEASIWVCALGRPAFAAARPSFGERAFRAQTIRLGALDAEAAAALCRKLLEPAENTPAAAIERLVQRAQAVPLLLVELVRGLKRDGLVRQRPGGGTWFLATDELDRLPDLPLIEWLAQRELGALPAELSAHARLAAVLGAEFSDEELEAVIAELDRHGDASGFPLDARVATRRLQSTGLLVASRQGLLRFRHALVRDAVARSLPEPQRHAIHEAAVRFYGAVSWVPETRRLPLLALHCARSGQKKRAAALYLDLAERARQRHAYLEAERTYSAALEMLDAAAGEERLLAFRGRAGMRYRIGRSEDALADFGHAREHARRVDDVRAEMDILLDEATALDWINDYARSAALVEEAGRLARLPGASSGLAEARLWLGRGRALFRENRLGDACAALEKAAQLAEAAGDDGYETLVISLVLLQPVLPAMNRASDAERIAARALELCESHGDQLHRSAVITNRRNLLVARKDVAAAIADQQLYMRIGRELGVITNEYFGEVNLGELSYYAGDLAQAERHARRAEQIEQRHRGAAPRPVGALLVARVLAFSGRLADARGKLDEVRRCLEQARTEGRASGELAGSEAVLLEMVDLATRASTQEEWMRLRERSARESVEQEPIEVIELHARTAVRLGRTDEARQAFADALHAAGRIPNIVEPRLRAGLKLLEPHIVAA